MIVSYKSFLLLTLLHSDEPELYRVLAVLSAIGLNCTIREQNNLYLMLNLPLPAYQCFQLFRRSLPVFYATNLTQQAFPPH